MVAIVRYFDPVFFGDLEDHFFAGEFAFLSVDGYCRHGVLTFVMDEMALLSRCYVVLMRKRGI